MELEYQTWGNPDSDLGILFCHGFGAHKGDLADLGPALDPQGKASWYFPQAPYLLPLPGYAWFPSRQELMYQALNGSYFADLAQTDDPGRTCSLDLLENFCKTKRHSRWILGGFSQGSMIALHLAARNVLPINKVILYSSALFALPMLERGLLEQSSTWTYLQTHGTQDQILTVQSGRQLNGFLQSCKIQGSYIEFKGYHEIPAEALAATLHALKNDPCFSS